MDSGHIYVSNGMKRGPTSSPHIGDVVMSLFFTLGSTVHDWGWPKNGPFWTKNGQTWQACQRSKVVQRGPKGTKMVNLSLFDHLGPRLGPSGPFWTISDKNDFFAPNGQNRVLQRCFRAKYQFLFKTRPFKDGEFHGTAAQVGCNSFSHSILKVERAN